MNKLRAFGFFFLIAWREIQAKGEMPFKTAWHAARIVWNRELELLP